jgi:hypothetical protein
MIKYIIELVRKYNKRQELKEYMNWKGTKILDLEYIGR